MFTCFRTQIRTPQYEGAVLSHSSNEGTPKRIRHNPITGEKEEEDIFAKEYSQGFGDMEALHSRTPRCHQDRVGLSETGFGSSISQGGLMPPPPSTRKVRPINIIRDHL